MIFFLVTLIYWEVKNIVVTLKKYVLKDTLLQNGVRMFPKMWPTSIIWLYRKIEQGVFLNMFYCNLLLKMKNHG